MLCFCLKSLCQYATSSVSDKQKMDMTKYLIQVCFITLLIDWQKWKLSGTGIVELFGLHHTKVIFKH